MWHWKDCTRGHEWASPCTLVVGCWGELASVIIEQNPFQGPKGFLKRNSSRVEARQESSFTEFDAFSHPDAGNIIEVC